MNRTRVFPNAADFPAQFRPLLASPVYDSSCSANAKVFYFDIDGGLFLKRAPTGHLQSEVNMTRYFHSLGLGPQVLSFQRGEYDWMLTRCVPGEDCCSSQHLSDPKQLSALMGELLRQLHSHSAQDCPVNRTKDYMETAQRNYRLKHYDSALFPDNWGYASAEEAWAVIEKHHSDLRADTLIHGDYCLPNVILENWRFSGFIDLGAAGLGDRHIDLFWGIWSLGYNLKTDIWRDRFLDAYGRDAVEEEMLRVIAAFEVFG